MDPMRFRAVAIGLLAVLTACATFRLERSPAEDRKAAGEDLLSNPRQLTFAGRRSGEGYFSADGSKLVFQSEREPGNPFFQIYWMDLGTGEVHRVSPGYGKTTCAWIQPRGDRVLFASTHEDPGARDAQARELERRACGQDRQQADCDGSEPHRIHLR